MLNKIILTALLKPIEQEKMAGRKQLEVYLIISDRDKGGLHAVAVVRTVGRVSNSMYILKAQLTGYSDVVDIQHGRKESRTNPK